MFKSQFAKISLVAAAVGCAWTGATSWAQRERTFEGTWINLFEGSSFFEGTSFAEACGQSFYRRASWLEFYPDRHSQTWRDIDLARRMRPGRFISEHGEWPVTAYRLKFVGRRHASELLGLAPVLGIGYGHLSSFGSEVVVEKLIAIEELPEAQCDVR